MQKEAFKAFVRRNPQLINFVQNKKMTWQQFYEIYDLYGEDNSIWNSFKETSSVNNNASSNITKTIKEIIGLVKGIDLYTVQIALTSLDIAIEAFKGFDSDNNSNTSNYQERPKYKYFED